MDLIYRNWAKLGGMIGAAILLLLLYGGFDIPRIAFLFWLHLAMLLLHQFEEYVYPGGFKDFFNRDVYRKNPITRFQLKDTGILVVNVIMGWSAYFLSALYHENTLWLAAGLLLISLFNGILHTGMAIRHRRYNPGLFTGFFLFIPFSLYVLGALREIIMTVEWISALLVFLAGTASIPTVIYLTGRKASAVQ